MKRFQFSIREMLLVVTIFALGLGWWMDHSHWQWVREKDQNIDAAVQTKIDEKNEKIRWLLEQNRSLGGKAVVYGINTDEAGNLLKTQ